ncbi:imidazoleglycerol-phosphate dehydratase [Archaeoglobus profundus]|uniref:Imidazoleglycerol-phosphate dehydratase n=1 Tax=Archaeoglobus profundus (strain DSM 5631 / JCM 9629 / NBRC 100127 / Av18) TaxID=572546 RepID=D2RGQ3_ARCPA|nr:imidazoleglycerol-phosphate dehydratase [Archaeoglobus profundus]ADB57478.1 Imidazoleglycerol-phosphate dehydratase [Archaeoglobus profundus DSM 5631]
MRVLRKAVVRRKTGEVDIYIELDLDSKGYTIEMDIPFFRHMLETLAKHSNVSLTLRAFGDDEHHTIEDTAIALGTAVAKALGDKRGIRRFGQAIVPMDDALAICGLDLSGRGYFVIEGDINENYVHFFDTFCRNSGMNVHLIVKGQNMHHKIEACFKALALAFRQAKEVIGEDVLSTKGVLD